MAIFKTSKHLKKVVNLLLRIICYKGPYRDAMTIAATEPFQQSEFFVKNAFYSLEIPQNRFGEGN
jgi:hypothetical protein